MSRICIMLFAFALFQCESGREKIFDGKTFRGWEGDTVNTWKIREHALTGGSLHENVPHNDFLCTTRPYSDFVLRLKFKLEGKEGFINAGVQFRSRRLEDPAYEMIGYQADLGDGYWGSLYDESRRNKTLAGPDSTAVAGILKHGDWNDYEIRAEGNRIRLYINDTKTVDYTEQDPSIQQSGLIGLQIHGGGKALVWYKDITITDL